MLYRMPSAGEVLIRLIPHPTSKVRFIVGKAYCVGCVDKKLGKFLIRDETGYSTWYTFDSELTRLRWGQQIELTEKFRG